MLADLLVLLWVTTLVFTILAIIYPQRFFLLLIPFFLWNVLGMAMSDIVYIGYGSMNIITQEYKLGDPYHPTWQIWVFHGIGIIFLIYAVGTYFQMASIDLRKIGEHKRVDTIIGRPEG